MAVFAVGFDDGGDCGGGEGETVVVVVVLVLQLVDDVPHGLVVIGIGEGFDDLFEFEGGGVVGRVVGTRPVEEAEGFGGRVGTRAEDAEDEFRGEGYVEFVEGAFHVEVAADDVGDVVDGGEVFVSGGFGGGG